MAASSRRKFLTRAGAYLGASLAAPAILRHARASSGTLRVLLWSDYLPEPFLEAFEAQTGIQVEHQKVGSNEEILAIMKETRGEGFDICSPTNMRSPQWSDLGLLRPLDYSKIANIENVNPAMMRIGDAEWNFEDEGPHWLPHVWGTEAIAWRTDLWSPPEDLPSYGDLWRPELAGKIMMRPHSGMLGAGLHLETIGELNPGDMRRAYDSEEVMRQVWDTVTSFCIENRKQIKLFWNDAETQKNALLSDEVLAGQTWDGPPLAMKSAGEPIAYRAPKEGALAWVDGLAIPRASQRLEEAYAFIDFCYQPEPAGQSINYHGYNSAVLGADRFAEETYKLNFAEAYPGNALSNLWPWPKEPVWYAAIRDSYRDKFIQA